MFSACGLFPIMILVLIYFSILALTGFSRDIPYFFIAKVSWVFSLGLNLLANVSDIYSCDILLGSSTKDWSMDTSLSTGLFWIVSSNASALVSRFQPIVVVLG